MLRNPHTMDANYFANLIANAPIQNSSRYFEAGIYHVKIDACKVFTNRQRRPRAAVDCTVIQSNNVNFPTTSQVSWVVALDNDSGPSTVTTFIANLMGCAAHEITPEVSGKVFPFIEDSAQSAQPSIAVGLQAIVNVFEKPTKSGGTYTKCDWKGFDPSKDEPVDFSSIAVVGNTPAVSAAAEPVSNNQWGGAPAPTTGGGWNAPQTQAAPSGNMPF